jgi:RNA recognition motif-containing protein
MSAWLFVDRLPPAVTSHQLKEMFSQFGTAKRALIFPNSRDRSCFCGYVEMTSPEETRQAALALNGSTAFGRQIRVLLVEHRPPKSTS